jgi:hypothetical protein
MEKFNCHCQCSFNFALHSTYFISKHLQAFLIPRRGGSKKHKLSLTHVSVIPQQAMLRPRLKNAMETRPSGEVNNHSTIQEFPNILWNQKVNSHFHTSLPLEPVLSQIYTVHTTPVIMYAWTVAGYMQHIYVKLAIHDHDAQLLVIKK